MCLCSPWKASVLSAAAVAVFLRHLSRRPTTEGPAPLASERLIPTSRLPQHKAWGRIVATNPDPYASGSFFWLSILFFQKPDRFGEPRLPLFAFASLLLHENGLTSCWNFPDTMALGIFFAERSRPVAGLGSHCRTVLAPQNVSCKWRCVKFARSQSKRLGDLLKRLSCLEQNRLFVPD